MAIRVISSAISRAEACLNIRCVTVGQESGRWIVPVLDVGLPIPHKRETGIRLHGMLEVVGSIRAWLRSLPQAK